MGKFNYDRELKKVLQFGVSKNKRIEDLLGRQMEAFALIFEKWAKDYELTIEEKKTIVGECFMMARDVILFQEIDKSGRLENRESGAISRKLEPTFHLVELGMLFGTVDKSEGEAAIRVLQKIVDLDETLSKKLTSLKSTGQASTKKIHDTYKVVIDIFRSHSERSSDRQMEPVYSMVADLHAALFGLDVENNFHTLRPKLKKLSASTIRREYKSRC